MPVAGDLAHTGVRATHFAQSLRPIQSERTDSSARLFETKQAAASAVGVIFRLQPNPKAN